MRDTAPSTARVQKPAPLEALADEFLFDRVIAHAAEKGETRYRTRWHGYSPEEDTTWELISHLPRSGVTAYYRRRKLPLPGNIGDAQVG